MALIVGTNSYISVADADTYFTDRLFATAWTALSAGDKAKALIMATQQIDRLTFKGQKVTVGQTLQFPRFVHVSTGYIETDSIPSIVEDATCEQALYLVQSNADARVQLQRAGVQSYNIGGLSETFTKAGYGKYYPDEVRMLLRPYLLKAVTIS